MKKALIIEAGHGLVSKGVDDKNMPVVAKDPGATGNGTTERAEVVQIASEAIAMIQKQPGLNGLHLFSVGVFEEKTLQQHIDAVNTFCKAYGYKQEEVLMVSIHVNSGGSDRIEAWYEDGSAEGEEFASFLTLHVSTATGIRRGSALPDIKNRHGRLGIVRDVQAVCALIECGFIDTIGNAQKLLDPIQDDSFAVGIVKAICEMNHVSYADPDAVFADIPPGHPLEKAAKNMKKKGWFKGYADGTVRPSVAMTRGEVMELLDRIFPDTTNE